MSPACSPDVVIRSDLADFESVCGRRGPREACALWVCGAPRRRASAPRSHTTIDIDNAPRPHRRLPSVDPPRRKARPALAVRRPLADTVKEVERADPRGRGACPSSSTDFLRLPLTKTSNIKELTKRVHDARSHESLTNKLHAQRPLSPHCSLALRRTARRPQSDSQLGLIPNSLTLQSHSPGLERAVVGSARAQSHLGHAAGGDDVQPALQVMITPGLPPP